MDIILHRRDIMSKKIKIIITFSIIIIVYFASYCISIYKFNNTDDSKMTIKTQQETVKKETKVKLTNRYLKSGEKIESSIALDEKLIGKGLDYVREYYKDKYTVVNVSKSQISLLCDYDTYTPGKYYLSIDKDKIAIFYIDKNLKINKAVDTDILIDYYQEGDRTSLEEGDIKYQFNSLEEAEESLTDYTS